MIRRFLLPALPLLAAGCATKGDFPSLRPRPVEQLSFEEPVRAETQVAANPGLRGRVAALLAEARRGEGLFSAAYSRALPLVRSAGPANWDSWVEAQAAITRVEAAGQVTSVAAADLDAFVAEQAPEPINAVDQQALVAAQQAAASLARQQDQRLDMLKARLGSS